MMKSSDVVNASQTIDVSGMQSHSHNLTYADGFNNKNSPGPMSGTDIYTHKSQYPSLPMMSPKGNGSVMAGRSGSMDHISAEMTDTSRSPSKLAV